MNKIKKALILTLLVTLVASGNDSIITTLVLPYEA